MPVALPYRFDTGRVWRMILTGALGVAAVVLGGVLHGLLVRRDAMVVLPLAVSGITLAYFIRLFVRFQSGSIGTLTADHVVIEPNTLFGLLLPGPRGDYPIGRFSAVRVELMSGPTDIVQGGPHERIWLVGRDGTPDVLVARTQREAGRALGRELGAALAVPVQETREPY
jgi:hypothetical protein